MFNKKRKELEKKVISLEAAVYAAQKAASLGEKTTAALEAELARRCEERVKAEVEAKEAARINALTKVGRKVRYLNQSWVIVKYIPYKPSYVVTSTYLHETRPSVPATIELETFSPDDGVLRHTISLELLETLK